MDARARITVPDVVFVVATLVVLGRLWPVVWDALAANAGVLGADVVYLFRLVLPLAGLVVVSVVFAKALAGSGVRS